MKDKLSKEDIEKLKKKKEAIKKGKKKFADKLKSANNGELICK